MARSYVNRLARFSSLDPLAGSTSHPQSLNRYGYTINDPVNLADPGGLRQVYAVAPTADLQWPNSDKKLRAAPRRGRGRL